MKKLILILILAGLVLPVMAQTPVEIAYTTEFNKLKESSDYIYRNGSILEYSIINFDPEFEYYIRVYTPRHTSIIQQFLLKEKSGKIPFTYPGIAPLHVNLQKWIPAGKEREYCRSYPCKIGENLDIINIDPASKTRTTDLYTLKLRYWTHSNFDKINGASWNAMINIDKGAL